METTVCFGDWGESYGLGLKRGIASCGALWRLVQIGACG